MSTATSPLITHLDGVLAEALRPIEESPFVLDLLAGKRVRALYEAYLQQAYHFVRLTSSFTPLSARRMDPSLLEARQWILHHSAHEMGHELMALDDLEKLGHARADIEASSPLPGTWAWVHFFHYQVTMRPPWAAMGVLYFLEGMAAKLAPVVAGRLVEVLEGPERAAISFVQEHGELDAEHSEEGKDILAKYCVDSADQAVVAETIVQASPIKRFMLDSLVASLEA